MRFRKALGLVVVALFLAALAGTATAASLDLPKWVIVPEDSQFSDVTLFCPLDSMDTTNNVTPCYLNGTLTNATIYFNSTTGYPKLVSGRIGNAFEFDGNEDKVVGGSLTINLKEFTIAFWMYVKDAGGTNRGIFSTSITSSSGIVVAQDLSNKLNFRIYNTTAAYYPTISYDLSNKIGQWVFVVAEKRPGAMELYINGELVSSTSTNDSLLGTVAYTYWQLAESSGFWSEATYNSVLDEFRLYNRTLTDDEIKLLYLAGRKKLSEPANFRQIFSPMIDLTRDRATFYAGLEVSTSDPNGYVPVPESAVNMSITTAPKLTSDYTGAPFYYEGHYWYQAQNIQYSLPIQFETVRQDGNFSHTVLLDGNKKTFVYEKEFKVTNPTAARINVVYVVNPIQLGFSALQYPQFELDGVRMVSWRPNNSSTPLLIATDTLEPGEVSTHWLKSTWTISKEELNFPAKLDDFRSISNWTVARKLAENSAEGKTDTYVRVIKIDSNADVSNVTILVPLKDVQDENDVIEATALTGARDTLQVEKLSDGKVVVKVPGQDFVSGHAEIKVLYNKSGGSWFSQLLEKIRSLMKKILSMFGLGGG
ncbi:LamG domain-containing protein [Thermococcus sp.]|uniref:LamG domain-containing protein n=1 Tax=Thermococcus sp. TaxID=35749 RepID=UPI002629F436|nr:LamG domain-containing protein [Thermococcus sp.]